jgi:cobalt-zinc-cadmium efflux system membrane fusion protein
VKFQGRIAALTLIALLAACSGEAPDRSEAGEGAAAGAEDGHDEHEEHEGPSDRTTIPAKTALDAGIRVGPAGPGEIADEHVMQGLLTPVEGRIAQVMARFPGPIRSLRANVGDRVRQGQPLATVESNLSLTTYTVNAPLAGVVLNRHASVGGLASEGTPLFEIADLSQVWVDLHVFGADAQHLRAGVPVRVTRLSDGVVAETTLERILPGTATASQSTVARATIDNVDGLWRPGSAVKARVTVGRQSVDLVVPLTALQSVGEQDVVYVREGTDSYRMRPVRVGRRDAVRVEILEGLRAGEQVVTEQSFLVKADIEKSTVEDEH